MKRYSLGLAGALLLCFVPSATSQAAEPPVLRLATTTSTADTGLLDALLPDFRRLCGCRVDVIPVGTGQALELGRRGDADVVLVHARAAEDRFVAEGHGDKRFDVMVNDFVLVGPKNDRAQARNAQSASRALRRIAKAQAPFVSRGDKSGTHAKELALWKAAGLAPTAEQAWYNAIGQGMGATLTFTNERRAYTLCDRGTWLSRQARLTNLRLLFGGNSPAANKDPALLNPYGVIAVSAQKHPTVKWTLAQQFIAWLRSPDTQRRIGTFGRKRFGQPLFSPSASK